MAGMPGSSILRPGHNVWRVEHAPRAAVLVDAAAYYGTLRRALLRAEHRVFIAGWDIDSRTPLVGPSGMAEDGLPRELGPFLAALAHRRPGLTVRLLLWDYAILYAFEREMLPELSLQLATPSQVELCLDNEVPLGASHHQKIVVVDDALAFSGGLDLTIRRWDRSEHRLDDPLRVDPAGQPYRPFHDVQMMVDGTAAQALGELFRARWQAAGCAPLPAPAPPGHDPWPEGVAPDIAEARIGIARTAPRYRGNPPVREVLALFEDMIASARSCLYIESQFLTCTPIAKRLACRLAERPELEAVIVVPRTHHTWFEHFTMQAGRIRFRNLLRRSGAGERVRILYPEVRDGEGRAVETMVHAKVTVVDDRLLRIGSANICNRSMGTDTECDLVIAAADAAQEAAIRRIRDRLAGDHCGAPADAVAEATAACGSLGAALERLGGEHRLRPVEDGERGPEQFIPELEAVADPPRPLRVPGLELSGRPPRIRLLAALRLGVVLLAFAALLLAWQFTPLGDMLNPSRLRASMAGAHGIGAPFLVVALFVLLGLLAFPLNLLIAATGAAFGFWPGIAYAAAGALASALATYGVGRWAGPGTLRDLFGATVHRIGEKVRQNGVLAFSVVRLVPVAPFSLVNLAAGALQVPLRTYLLGTAIGLAPGLLLLGAAGDRLPALLHRPSATDILALIGILLLLVLLSIGFRIALRRWRGDGAPGR